MKTRLFALGVACVALLSAARAQTNSAAQAALQSATPSASPSRIIYTQQLPAVGDLSRAAAEQHQTIQKIDQTAGQMVVTYQGTDGQTSVVSYQTIANGSGSATAASAVATPTSAAPVVGYTAATAPTAVYTPATTTVVYAPGYYDYPYSPYYGYYGYSPVHVNLGFGIGYRGGWGGYHGGYGGSHGGWHR